MTIEKVVVAMRTTSSGSQGGTRAVSPDDEVRARIVGAADALFYARGIQSVGMDEVREAAGVSLKKLYTYFPGKEQLVLAVLAWRHGLWESGIAQSAQHLSDPRDRLLAVYDFLERWFTDETFRGCGFINAFGELGATSPAVAEAARDHKEQFTRYVEEVAAEAGAGEELAAQLVLLAEGAQTTAAIAGRPDAARHARRAAEVLIAAALDAR